MTGTLQFFHYAIRFEVAMTFNSCHLILSTFDEIHSFLRADKINLNFIEKLFKNFFFWNFAAVKFFQLKIILMIFLKNCIDELILNKKKYFWNVGKRFIIRYVKN